MNKDSFPPREPNGSSCEITTFGADPGQLSLWCYEIRTRFGDSMIL